MGNLASPIIFIQNLSKVYRLYTKPHYRMMDMFGLLKNNKKAYTEHAALDNVSLQVNRGEKVAIIGRNGAGKSTLLKIITNVIRPTSGTIEVHGKIQALLQIGTGFHPEFTGRENVYGYLAQLGLTRKEADEKVREIIEFSELEEYIDQPMKTYSTGMGVRLMFSTSTAIIPNLLVLDEVMGVGDSYFSQKSYDRMKELCEGQGTTLLMVTHDVYSAANICNRAIWIDRGRVLIDGESKTVVKAYEDSIRQQEEQRLRLKKQQQLQVIHQEDKGKEQVSLLLEFRCQGGVPQSCPIYFSKIEVKIEGYDEIILPLVKDSFQSDERAHLQKEGSNWGDVLIWDGRNARPMLNYGSPFHKVAGVAISSCSLPNIQNKTISLIAEYWVEEPCAINIFALLKENEVFLGMLPQEEKISQRWNRFECKAKLDFNRTDGNSSIKRIGVNVGGVHGTGSISVVDITAINDVGKEAYHFQHGMPMTIIIRYKIHHPALKEKAQVLLAFKRNGVQDVARSITRSLTFDAQESRSGEIEIFFQKLSLGNGCYSMTVMIVKEGYYDQEQTQFYSINLGVYYASNSVLDFEVVDGGLVGEGTGVVVDAVWMLRKDLREEITIE